MYETVDGYTTSRPIHPPPKISKSQVSHLMTGNGTVGFGSATEFNARGASVSVGRSVVAEHHKRYMRQARGWTVLLLCFVPLDTYKAKSTYTANGRPTRLFTRQC